MPDYFVPLDTTHSSKYFNELFAVNSIREYAFNYAEENKDRFEKMGFETFRNKFTVDDKMLSQLVAMGEREKVKRNPSDLARNKSVFQNYLKAEIARRVWGNPSFYPIFNESNEVLQQVIKNNLFDRAPELDRSKF
jgi:carboxyl-terminal processing protease